MQIEETAEILSQWGSRLRAARINRNGPTSGELTSLADGWGVDDAGEIVSQVVEAVRNFAATARKLAVRGSDSLEAISADIRKRLETIAP